MRSNRTGTVPKGCSIRDIDLQGKHSCCPRFQNPKKPWTIVKTSSAYPDAFTVGRTHVPPPHTHTHHSPPRQTQMRSTLRPRPLFTRLRPSCSSLWCGVVWYHGGPCGGSAWPRWGAWGRWRGPSSRTSAAPTGATAPTPAKVREQEMGCIMSTAASAATPRLDTAACCPCLTPPLTELQSPARRGAEASRLGLVLPALLAVVLVLRT